jgi:hypothetical protein
VERPIAEVDSETADPSVRGARIADLIIERIFAAASLPMPPPSVPMDAP